MYASPAGESARILIVDDRPANRLLLKEALAEEPYVLSEAADGLEALAQMDVAVPDCVLLDVMMPGIDGFEVCRRMQANPILDRVPVLMVTALDDRDSRIAGIAAGAYDFLSKPIDLLELVLRVRNAVRGKRLHDDVQASLERQVALENLRDHLTNMIVHDMRGSLMGIQGFVDLALRQSLPAAADRHLTKVTSQLQQMSWMVDNLLDIRRLQEGRMPLNIASCSIRSVMQSGVDMLGALAHQRTIHTVVEDDLAWQCDEQLMVRVLGNLVYNALKFSPPDDPITLRAHRDEDSMVLRVIDQGPGIDPELRTRIFEPFVQGAGGPQRYHGSGLGLAFCRLVIEAHGGCIGVKPAQPIGADFWIRLPETSPTPLAEA